MTLDLYIPETYNVNTLTVQDNSIYDEGYEVANQIVEIKPPGKDCYIPFYVTNNDCPWKISVYDCILLQLCKQGCSSIAAALPDGIYEIKYSIDPNLSTMVEFSHLRVTRILKRLAQVSCAFFGMKCDYKKSKYKELLDKLIEIEFTINAAKWKVEECLEPEEGIALYKRADELLKEFENEGCSCH